MTEPKHWPNLKYPKIDYQDIIYYSAPKQKVTKASLDEVILNCCARSRNSAFR